jgi:phosphoribosylaminoimidazole-succinocarboxamide synthase
LEPFFEPKYITQDSKVTILTSVFVFNIPIMALTTISLNGALPLTTRGKVRDLYILDEKSLLFVATDRISAFDVTMANGIPDKGRLLTHITKHWLDVLTKAIPDLKTHFISLDLPPLPKVPENILSQFRGRSMQVRKYKVFPLEAIVRGYITGSAWQEYKKTKTVHGTSFEVPLEESQAFPNGPIYTPSTKAPAGEKDQNITKERAAEIVGQKYADRIEQLSLQLYKAASDYATERGIIIADTKFEFGFDEETDEVVLVDEVLTPDSSRFWDKQKYRVGESQESFDKQYLRDWLIKEGLKGREAVEIPANIVQDTLQRYKEVYERLVGKKWE